MSLKRLSCRLWAALLLTAVLSASPARGDEASDLYDKAIQKAEWFDWEGSIPLLDQAIELRPDYIDAWQQRGLAYFNEKQYEQAIKNFDQVVTLKPDLAAAFLTRANSYNLLGNLDKAIEDYTKVIALEPENAEAHQKRGDAQLTLGENAKAVSDLTEAIRLKPDEETAYRSRAFAYAADEQNEKAAADFAKVVEINPSESQDYHNLGVIYLRLGKHADAIQAFTNALRLNPQRDNSYYSRGNAHVESGDLDSALSDFTRVIELNPKKADAWGHRGLILLEKGRDAAAQRDLNRCFELAPSSRAAYTQQIDEVLKRRKVTPESADVPDDAPITPEDAVEQYEAAAKAGNVERIGELYYEPVATPYRELFQAYIQVGSSKRRLAASLDKRFGRDALKVPIPDDRQIRDLLKRTLSITTRSKVSDDQGYVLTVEIVEIRSDGHGTTTTEERFLAREQGGMWRVGPARSDESIRATEVAAAAVKKLPAVIDQIRADVEAGKFVSRYDAEQALIAKAGPIMGDIK